MRTLEHALLLVAVGAALFGCESTLKSNSGAGSDASEDTRSGSDAASDVTTSDEREDTSPPDVSADTPGDQGGDESTDEGPVVCKTAAVLPAHPDEKATKGQTYTVTPQVSVGAVERWRKSYGPDAVQVNARTGELSWDVPAGLPSESFHVGVRGVDVCGGMVEDVWVVTVGDGEIVRMGQGQQYTRMHEAMAAAGSGGTVIVEPGVYPSENSLSAGRDPRHQPRSGTPEAFTTIIAAEPGQSIFESSISMDAKWGPTHHIAVKGLHTRRSISTSSSQSSGATTRVHHIKFIDVGVEGILSFSQSDDMLVEGAYLFGGSRYKFSAYKSNRVIVRRTLMRQDHAPLTGDLTPYGGAVAYTSNDVVFQNVLDIDSDQSQAYPSGQITGSFGVPVTAGPSQRVVYERAISLNNRMKFSGYYSNGGSSPRTFGEVTYRDVVGWDIRTPDGDENVSSGNGHGLFEHATFGEISSFGDVAGGATAAYFGGWCGNDEMRDAFLSGIDAPLFYNFERLSHLAFQNAPNQTPISRGSCDGFTQDPIEHRDATFMQINDRDDVLKHLPRPEPSGALIGAGTNGSNIGATVMTFLGRSGTFHGEPGWDQETGISMWPYPNEERVARALRAYTYNGPIRGRGDVDVTGDRGFAREDTALDGGPLTLTSYIWEYLGHPCPADICRP